MDSSMGNEIVVGFIGEVEGYLPDMDRCLQALQQDRVHRPSLAELHRITHTIKGAAAMVGLDDLSGMGEILERVMENVLGESLSLDDDILILFGDAAQHINSYCAMQRAGIPIDDQLFQKTIAAIEERLAQGIAEFGEPSEEDEQPNPEAILLQDDLDEENEFTQDLEEEPDIFDDDIAFDMSEDISEEEYNDVDADSFFDDIASAEEAEKDEEDDFFFESTEEEAEKDEDIAFISGAIGGSQNETTSEEIDPELLQCFREETEEHLENIDSCLNTLSAQITELSTLTPDSQETLHSLRRSVHTLKGAAAVIGIEQVAAWGHDFEDFLDWLHDEAQQLDPSAVAALREGADLLASLAEDPTLSVAEEKQRTTVRFADVTELLTSSSISSVVGEGVDKARQEPGSATDFSFTELEEDSSEEDESFFDEISSNPVSPEEGDDDADFFLQVTDEADDEDDLFGEHSSKIGTEFSDPDYSEDFFAGTAQGESERKSDIAEIDPELLECFQEETEEHLENIDHCLRDLTAEVSEPAALNPDTQEKLHSLRRSVHTLKGAAAVIGIEPVAAWGHDFEDFLDWLHDEAQRLDPAIIAALQEGADFLASLAEDPTYPTGKTTKRITKLFTDITSNFSSGTVFTEHTEAAVFLADVDNGEQQEGGEEDFFAELSESTSSAEEAIENELFLQNADEEDEEDFFGAAVEGGEGEDVESSVEAIDPELLECFQEETDEHLENIDDCINRLGAKITAPAELTTSTRETLHSLRRSVHTLKGAAAVIGIDQIAAWGHDFEDFLDWLHDEGQKLTSPIITLLREGADLLAELAEHPSRPVEQRKKSLAVEFDRIVARAEVQENASLSAMQDEPADQDFFSDTEGKVENLLKDVTEDKEESDSFFDELPIDSSREIQEELFVSSPEHDEQVDQEDSVEIDEELLQCFHEEAEEHLDNIDRQLNHLGMTVSDNTQLTELKKGSLHSIRRSVHTLKGAAAVIGVEPVAAWGHDFEDFLDWLHDEARVIRPDVVKAMQRGADILVRLVEDPSRSARTDQKYILEEFSRITTGDAGQPLPDHNTQETPAESSEPTSAAQQAIAKKGRISPAQQGQVKRTASLRVDVNRVDQMVGLSGDMVINLSSFEDSMDAMSGTMKELDMILQRLKNINSSLEAGYELASIPHLGNQDDALLSGITEDFDPLEMDRYSELNILIRSLSEAVSDLDSIMAQNALDNITWQKTVERQGMVLKELQNRMMGVRMTPLSTLSSRMQRTVREAERTTGHPARLTIEGESIMMDTRVWDVMADPLMHILRNAVAHGGRLPQKAGWNPLSITIKAIRKGGQCTLRVSDDGTGLDYEAIRVKGMKLYPDDRVNLMSDDELAELIFRHGFSSTGSVTNIAGRGVGMDVVRDAIDQLNGSIELVSERGQGTEFIMRLPVAVAQLPAILARFGSQVYAIPMHDVVSVVRATPDEKRGREYTFEDEDLPLLHLGKVPGFETGSRYITENLTEEDQAILIVHAGRKRAALLCEQLIGQRDIVFKDLGTHLYNVPCISGVTIMGDGSLIPILQVEEVLEKWTSVVRRRSERSTIQPYVEERGPLRVLVVDDSISVRKVVSNFITQQGWLPVAARNGIEAIEKIREEKPDFVLLDVEMPRMNGFEVLQTLQAQPELRDIPVAMLTSRSADKYQEKARELGARGFMTKPFKADEVIDFIRKVTEKELV